MNRSILNIIIIAIGSVIVTIAIIIIAYVSYLKEPLSNVATAITGFTAPVLSILGSILLYFALIQQIRSTELISESENYKGMLEMFQRWTTNVRGMKYTQLFESPIPVGVFDATIIDIGQFRSPINTILNRGGIVNYEIWLGRLNAEIQHLSRHIDYFTDTINDLQKISLIHSELHYINNNVVSVSTAVIASYISSDNFNSLPFRGRGHIELVFTIFRLKMQEVNLARRIDEIRRPQPGDINVPVFYADEIALQNAINAMRGNP